jgi:hypothetical protein
VVAIFYVSNGPLASVVLANVICGQACIGAKCSAPHRIKFDRAWLRTQFHEANRLIAEQRDYGDNLSVRFHIKNSISLTITVSPRIIRRRFQRSESRLAGIEPSSLIFMQKFYRAAASSRCAKGGLVPPEIGENDVAGCEGR